MDRDKFGRPVCICKTPVHPGYTICYQCKRGYTTEMIEEAMKMPENAAFRISKTPTKPGFYWALWMVAAAGTHEGEQLTPASKWEIVEVWENFIGDPCEADRAEKFGVSVPGIREAQWLENFKWGNGPLEHRSRR